MFIIFIVLMDMEKGILDNSSLLALGLQCCLEQLWDLWLTNSEIHFFFLIVLLPYFSVSYATCFEIRGRKRACVTYCITYIASCITKHSPQYRVLMLGRILGGIATSLLFSAFESWLVAEHFKVRNNFFIFFKFSAVNCQNLP